MKVVDFFTRTMTRIDGAKLIKVAGILLLIIGILDMLTFILLDVLIPQFAMQIDVIAKIAAQVNLPLLDFASASLEIAAGVSAFYFAKHKKKCVIALPIVFGIIMISTFMMSFFTDVFSKVMTYAFLLPAYLYLFGVNKQREAAKYENFPKYKEFYEKHKELHEEDS